MILAAQGIIDYALRAKNTYTSISDMNNIHAAASAEEKEDLKTMNIFRILYVLQHLDMGLNILGFIILSCLLYSIIKKKQDFFTLSLFFIPFDVVMRTLFVILILLMEIPGIDHVTKTVAHLITVLILNITWLLTILYKQQIQRETGKEKTM